MLTCEDLQEGRKITSSWMEDDPSRGHMGNKINLPFTHRMTHHFFEKEGTT
jgi:hypothetical protein